MNDALLFAGAGGFIGRQTLPLLRAAAGGRAIVLAGRSDAPAREAGLPHWPLDLAAPQIELPLGIGTVLHLAGEKRDTASMAAVNHAGTARLVDAAARAGARRFVHLSSVGVYGARMHAGVVAEDHPHKPQNAYEASKSAGERAVRERCAALGLACVVLQPSNVVGIVPGAVYPLRGLTRMVARGWFRYFGRGDAWVNYVAVEDVAAAVCAAVLSDTAQGVFIVNVPVTLQALIGWIADELDLPAPTRHWPWWAGALAAQAGALGRRVLGRELAFSPERFRELTNTTRYDGSAITRSLGFAYQRGIEAALRSMVRRYRAEGLI
jgi:nucleoside-diphosphate-sugar epimerase